MNSSHQSLNNSARIAAIRELVETEQRYVHDLNIVSNDFIQPLINGRILNDQEIDRLFSNWFSLIACNTIFLSTLQEQVQCKDLSATDQHDQEDVSIVAPRSVSLLNIAKVTARPLSYVPEVSQTASAYSFASPFSTLPRKLTQKRWKTPEILQDNIVPRSTLSMSQMTITDATNIGDILCSYIPYMADAYFQYCNCSSQANKYLQTKIELNENFRCQLELFQEKNNGLSLNGFLTKPIQRVTRYPLLIEKILKHTPIDHADYESVRKAFESARQLTERINQRISEQENNIRLDWLQQHLQLGSDENCSDGYIFDELIKFNSKNSFLKQRQLLLHGALTKIPSGRELLVFLFNDFLLLSTIKSSSNNWRASLFESKTNLQLKLYRLPILLKDISSATEQVTDQYTFTITTKIHEKPLVLKAQQTNLRTLWVRAITNALEEVQNIDRFDIVSTDQSADLQKPIARLIIVVQEAYDLQLPTTPSQRNRKHAFADPYCQITVNSVSLRTPCIKRTNQPKWNTTMEFILYNILEDSIHINLFDHQFFSPNENLGHTSVQLSDILPCPFETYREQSFFPFTQQIYLNNGTSIVVKCTLNML